MRVLITTDVVGGVWQFTQELTLGLLSNDCAVALVSVGEEPSPAHRAWVNEVQSQAGESFCFHSTTAPLEWMQDNQRAYWDVAPVLLDVCEAFKPDLLHLNQFCFGVLPVDAPRVITAHSDVLSWADACRDEPLESSEWLTRYCNLVRAGLEEATVVVAPTNWMLSALSANFPLPETSAVIENGRKVFIPEGQVRQMRAITAGRIWDEAKDVRMLQEVRSPFPMVVAGESRDAAAELGNDRRIRYLGRLAEAELLREFSRSAIYICTSRYEPFGLAPLEAALCGCAVVARNIPSLREVWGEGALYFADAGSLTQLLSRLQDAEQLEQAQMRSSLRARRFTREKMVSKYLALYADTLARTGAREHVA